MHGNITLKISDISVPLVPVLELDTSAPLWMGNFRSYATGTQKLDYVRVKLCNSEAVLLSDHVSEFVTLSSGDTVQVMRDKNAEEQAISLLAVYGFEAVPSYVRTPGKIHNAPVYCLDSVGAWQPFIQHGVPLLINAGWNVVIPKDFRHTVLEVEAWEGEFIGQGNGWFSLRMGIVVNGHHLPLAPLLHALFKIDPRWLDAYHLERIQDSEAIELLLPDEGRVRVTADRIKPLARTLIELFDKNIGSEILLSSFDLDRIDTLAGMERWQFNDMEAVTNLAHKLKNTAGIRAVNPPEGFAQQLRPYQLEGLSWLQFLLEHGLSGILADDMGLGKTPQILAHLLTEKQSGRMDKPSLVVLPKTLIFNWKREAKRFAPQLKMLSLHGSKRAERFPLIQESDVVLTTYPLVWRDIDALAEHEFHLLILDEAQLVKNASSRAAQALRKLHARHRLCLTGTPIENNLGELWTQFDFLLLDFWEMPRNSLKHGALQSKNTGMNCAATC